MLKLNKTYLYITITLLVIEICIALFLKDGYVRYTFGDFLATILVYCGLKSILDLKPITLFIITLAIAYTLEGFQYINLLERLNLQDYKLLKIILGSHFSWKDILAYSLGAITIYLIDKNTINEQKEII